MSTSGPDDQKQWEARRDAPRPGPTLKQPAFDSAELLSRIWLQNLPIMRDRVASLETAAAEALHGTLSAARRTEASDIAHKLAGSLGMFGYPAGTDIARLMEQMLEAEDPVDAPAFVSRVVQLRAALPL